MVTTKGTYPLMLRMPASKEIKVGKLGRFVFHRGCYIYIGSALGGLEGRPMPPTFLARSVGPISGHPLALRKSLSFYKKVPRLWS